MTQSGASAQPTTTPSPTIPSVEQWPPLRAELPPISYVECANWTRNVTRGKVDLIVLHCMESPDTETRAEQSARRMAGPNAPRASAHYFVDCNSIVRGLGDKRIAWHAPGANRNGIGIEHAGWAKQTREAWLDEFGVSMFDLSAQLTESLCTKWKIPIAYVNAAGLLADPQQRGITTHHEVTKAFKLSTHTDPGPGFPIDWYIMRALAYRGLPPVV